MSRKNKEIPGAIKSFVVYDQRYPLKKESRYGESYYEANIVKVGEIKATHAGEALDLAKTRGLSKWPMVWSAETESKRDKYKQRQIPDEDDSKETSERRYNPMYR